MHSWAIAALALGLLASPAQAGCEPGETVIRLGHNAPATDNPKADALDDFAARADLALQGRACVQVLPGTDDAALLAGLAAGRLQLAVPDIASFAPISKRVQVYDLPFLFPDIAAVEAFQASAPGRAMLGEIEAAGLRVLGHWHGGLTQLSANRPLLRPGDARGLTFATAASAVQSAQFATLGAKARVLGLGEIDGALAAGQLDGQASTWDRLADKKAAALGGGVTETNHGVREDLLVAARPWWDALPADRRATLTRLLVETTHDHNRLNLERQDLARARLLRDGRVVRALTPDQRAQWVAALMPVWQTFERDIGADTIAAALEASAP